MTTTVSSRLGKILPSVVYLFSFLSLLPLIIWLGQSTASEDQLTNALAMIILVSGFLYFDQKLHLHLSFVFSKVCQTTLITGYALIGVSTLLQLSPSLNAVLVVTSLSLFLFSFLHYLFGEENKFFLNSIVIAMTGFIIFAILQPYLDIPLRFYAGRASGIALELIGLSNQLFLVLQDEPRFILNVEGTNYLVAPECNGFGVISTSLLMGLLISFYYRISVIKKLLFILACFFAGFVFNVLRIIGIIIAAPHVGEHYDLVHEIIGVVSFISSIGLILYFSIKVFKSPSLSQ